MDIIYYTNVGSGSNRNQKPIDEFAEIIRKRVAEAIQIGYNDTAGDYTDVGITHHILVDLGILPVEDR